MRSRKLDEFLSVFRLKISRARASRLLKHLDYETEEVDVPAAVILAIFNLLDQIGLSRDHQDALVDLMLKDAHDECRLLNDAFANGDEMIPAVQLVFWDTKSKHRYAQLHRSDADLLYDLETAKAVKEMDQAPFYDVAVHLASWVAEARRRLTFPIQAEKTDAKTGESVEDSDAP